MGRKYFYSLLIYLALFFIGKINAQEFLDKPYSYDFVGFHLISSYQDCDASRLKDLTELKKAMQKAVEASGATLLNSMDYVFPPHGLTLVMLLSESHASIHTYPEYNSCFIDFFTCGRGCSSTNFDTVLQEYLRPKNISSRLIYRDGQTARVVEIKNEPRIE